VLAPALAVTRPVARVAAIGRGKRSRKPVAKLWNAVARSFPDLAPVACELLAIRDRTTEGMLELVMIAVMEKAQLRRTCRSEVAACHKPGDKAEPGRSLLVQS